MTPYMEAMLRNYSSAEGRAGDTVENLNIVGPKRLIRFQTSQGRKQSHHLADMVRDKGLGKVINKTRINMDASSMLDARKLKGGDNLKAMTAGLRHKSKAQFKKRTKKKLLDIV